MIFLKILDFLFLCVGLFVLLYMIYQMTAPHSQAHGLFEKFRLLLQRWGGSKKKDSDIYDPSESEICESLRYMRQVTKELIGTKFSILIMDGIERYGYYEYLLEKPIPSLITDFGPCASFVRIWHATGVKVEYLHGFSCDQKICSIYFTKYDENIL